MALCSAGADITAVNSYGHAVIHTAAEMRHQAVVVALLDQGGEVNMVSGILYSRVGWGTLQILCSYGGEGVEIKSEMNRTNLHEHDDPLYCTQLIIR